MAIVERCLNGQRSKQTITGSTVLKYYLSPFIVWCDAFAPFEERDPENSYLRLLFKRGRSHEDDVVKKQHAKRVEMTSFEDGFRKAIDNCTKGANILSNTPLFYLPEDVFGIPDLLVRDNSHGSVFGKYHYVIKEIKSAKYAKKEYILQAALYNYILGKVQGYTPPRFALIDRDGKERWFEYSEIEKELLSCVKGIREILEGKKVSPTVGACRWPWQKFCLKQAMKSNDVSLLPYVGSTVKKKLNEVGVNTVQDFYEFDGELDIPPPTFKKMKTFAKAWVEKKPVVLQKPKLPSADVELYIDFEGTDELQLEEGRVKVDYLVGVLVKKGDDVQYHAFKSDDLSGEKKMFDEFIEFMSSFPDAPVFCYGSYEKTHIKDLAEKHGVDCSALSKRLVDVLQVLKRSVALPLVSMSLKDVGKFVGYEWRGMESAQESIVLFLEYMKSKDKTVLDKIIQYNEDDVRATLAVKEFLLSL